MLKGSSVRVKGQETGKQIAEVPEAVILGNAAPVAELQTFSNQKLCEVSDPYSLLFSLLAGD